MAGSIGWPPKYPERGVRPRVLAPGYRAPLPFSPDARLVSRTKVNLLIGAIICLGAAQLLGIYGLATRKADLIFALLMIGLLTAAVVMGLDYAYHRVH